MVGKFIAEMNIVEYLENRLKQTLPGEEAQIKMAHAFRRKLWKASSTAIDAGVLALLYPRNNEWMMVFIERTGKNPEDKHSGQISFPGGKKEPIDSNMIECALREANEEVGINPADIQLLGQLTPLYIPVSDFLVHPVIGVCYEDVCFTPNPDEVQDIIELPFDHFLDQNNIKHMDMIFGSGMKMEDVPYYDAYGKVIWGATAMIISEMVVLIEENKVT